MILSDPDEDNLKGIKKDLAASIDTPELTDVSTICRIALMGVKRINETKNSKDVSQDPLQTDNQTVDNHNIESFKEE